jgi:hypothetical protein
VFWFEGWLRGKKPLYPSEKPGNTKGGKYHSTIDLLFGISCMTTAFLVLFEKQTNPNQSNRSTVQGYFHF